MIGVHTAGYNSSAFGTSVLGTYTSKAPESAVLRAYEATHRLEVHAAGVAPDALVVYPDPETLPAIQGTATRARPNARVNCSTTS